MSKQILIDKYVEAHAGCRWMDAGDLDLLLHEFADELEKGFMEKAEKWLTEHYRNYFVYNEEGYVSGIHTVNLFADFEQTMSE